MVAIAKRALVVARNALNGSEATSGLEQLGCSVDAAGMGLDALRLMGKRCPYDLIVTELLLDRISGLALVIIARKKNPAIRTIAINNGSKALRLFAMESGVDRLLQLPLDAERVYEAAGLILAETTVKDDATNELTASLVWL
jgi:CheY-like chemotaxis protein